MPKKSGSHHVVPGADGGWDVKKSGSNRASGHFDKNVSGHLKTRH
jgi:hypothetical protein